jgi:hypothetical protein
VRSTLSVLAAVLVMAAGTGCSEDKGDESAAVGTTTGSTAAQDTSSSALSTTTAQSETTSASPTTAPTTTETAPTAPINAWARKADAICVRWQRQIDAVPAPATEAQLAPALSKTLVPIRKQEQALKQLGPPKENVTIGLAFIGSIVSARKAIEQVVAGIRADDPVQTQDGYAKAAAAGERTRGYAVQLGLVHCGSKRRLAR